MPSFPIVTVPHPLASLPDEDIRRIGAGIVAEIVGNLTRHDGGAS